MIRVLHKTKGFLLMREDFPPNYSVKLHKHRNKEVFFIRKGTGYIHLDGKVIEIQQGSVIAVPPGILHGIETFDHSLECMVTVEGNHTEEIDQMYDHFTKLMREQEHKQLQPQI